MFFFAGSVKDVKTEKSKYVALRAEGNFWHDDKRTRYDRTTGQGVIVKRLMLDLNSIIPILFSHVGAIKNSVKDTGNSIGTKVFLARMDSSVWITHEKDTFHAGHGQHVLVKGANLIPGDYRRYLVLSSIINLPTVINFQDVKNDRNILRGYL